MDIKETKTGLAVMEVKFNSAANKYLGFVKDPKWGNKFITCTWHKSGKCINRSRPDLDIDVKEDK